MAADAQIKDFAVDVQIAVDRNCLYQSSANLRPFTHNS